MQTLALAMQSSPEEGEALPSPFRRVTALGAIHRRGQVSVVAAGSGGGKSAYATHISVHGRHPWEDPIPTLYFSADSDKITLGTRVAASLVNRPLAEVEQALRNGDSGLWAKVAEIDWVWWCWNAQPSCRDIEEETEAYAYVNGEWPHLIVVDNLINVDSEGEAGHVQKDAVMHWLQQLANLTNAHVMVLHHVVGEYENGTAPIPKSALLDKVAKRPRLVLTLWKPGDNLLGVSVVKNSTGRAASDGSYGTTIGWMPERSWFTG